MPVEVVKNILDPWDIFLKVSEKPYPFILDRQTDISNQGIFSIVGFEPFVVIKAWQDKVEITRDDSKEIKRGDPFSILDSILSIYKKYFERELTKILSDYPYMPCCGLVGYFGYDLKNHLEKLPKKTSEKPFIPDLIMGIYDTVLVYDYLKRNCYIVSLNVSIKEKIDDFEKTLGHELPIIDKDKYQTDRRLFSSNFTREGYIDAVKRAKGYISAGDIYQINLSQRFKIPFKGDPASFYSKLRKTNPVPYSAYLDYGDFQIISNSPECFLKIQDGFIETCPIKGTRPRGKDKKEDEAVKQELRTNQKELAEHIMIVDLERNDIGKVCRTGTVNVTELERIDTYPTLHHMVSCVKGEIKNGISPIGCIKACFPGGSVTGAPKIKAMEIIDELEPAPRGIYTGAIGYIDFMGRASLGMAIRTAVVSGSEMQLSVGGGIVADSIPEAEYEETILKAEAFFRCLEK